MCSFISNLFYYYKVVYVHLLQRNYFIHQDDLFNMASIGNVDHGQPWGFPTQPAPKTAPVCAGVGFQQEQVKGSVKPTGTESCMGLQWGFSIESKG